MPLFIIHGESQMLRSESGLYLQMTDEDLAWVDSSESSVFNSPQEGKDAAVLYARAMIERAKTSRGRSRRKLSEFVPPWVSNFIDDKDELDEEGLLHELHAQELDEDLSDSETTRFYVKTDEGWIKECDNGMSVGYEFCWSFSSAYAFLSRAGALAAIDNLDVENYALMEANISFSTVHQQGMKDGEVSAVSAGIERSILRKEVSEKKGEHPQSTKSL